MAGSNRDEPLSFLNPSSSSPITPSDGDGYLCGDQFGSASGSLSNDGLFGGFDTANGSGGSDLDLGFFRPEFRQSQLVGTVEPYDRHVFLCYKNPRVWPARIEAAEFDRLPRLLSAAVVARKADMKKMTRLTICEGHDGSETSNGDILIFPDMIRYRRLTHFDVDTFVDEVLVKDVEWLPGTPENLKGSYIFVCCHGSRDRRCGVCGPALVSRFMEEIVSHGLQGKVFVRPCSHIGGHKYAGNVIIFGSNTDGEVTGHWYGYVTPDDASILLDQHILKGDIVDFLWRGQMGLSELEQSTSQELRLIPNGGIYMEKNTNESIVRKSEVTNPIGCGQENMACCQTPKAAVASNDKETKVSTEKKTIKKQFSRVNSLKGRTRKVCTIPSLLETWEREDTYVALSVVCAAVFVAVTYNSYKKLM